MAASLTFFHGDESGIRPPTISVDFAAMGSTPSDKLGRLDIHFDGDDSLVMQCLLEMSTFCGKDIVVD